MARVRCFPNKEVIELTLLILSGKLDEREDSELINKVLGKPCGGNRYALYWRATKEIIKNPELFARLKNK